MAWGSADYIWQHNLKVRCHSEDDHRLRESNANQCRQDFIEIWLNAGIDGYHEQKYAKSDRINEFVLVMRGVVSVCLDMNQLFKRNERQD